MRAGAGRAAPTTTPRNDGPRRPGGRHTSRCARGASKGSPSSSLRGGFEGENSLNLALGVYVTFSASPLLSPRPFSKQCV